MHYYATDSLLYLYKNKLSFMNFFTNLLRMQTNKKKIVFKLFLYVAFFITFPSLVYCQVSIKRYFLFDTLKKNMFLFLVCVPPTVVSLAAIGILLPSFGIYVEVQYV